MSDFKVLDSSWFTPGTQCIGIVIGELPDGTRKAYIRSTEGYDIRIDTEIVAKFGTPFPLDAAYELFKYLKPK
jgi:hypothetical protein